MSPTDITRVVVEGLHGHYRYDVSFKPGLTVLHGRNAAGKTTLLHILANLTEGDISRFCSIRFSRITVVNAQSTWIDLVQEYDEETEDLVIKVLINDVEQGRVSENRAITSDLSALLEIHLGGLPVYLPAFRSVLEAITRDRLEQPGATTSGDEELSTIRRHELARFRRQMRHGRGFVTTAWQRRVSQMARKTILCRSWFGGFVPLMRCPSLWEIAERISEEVNTARLEVAESDRVTLSAVFSKVIDAVAGGVDAPEVDDTNRSFQRIEDLLKTLQDSDTALMDEYGPFLPSSTPNWSRLEVEETTVRRVLHVYERALEERVKAQEDAFSQLRILEESVNRLIVPKRLDLYSGIQSTAKRSLPKITLDGGNKADFGVLSSGERHILTLLFSATHMSASDGLVLIDEPELSLHIDWQRSILTELMKQAGNRQIVVCTHSPEIAADHLDVLVELEPKQWSIPGDVYEFDGDGAMIEVG